MVDSYEEWWNYEISEKFNALMSWLQKFAFGCLFLELGELWYRPTQEVIAGEMLILNAVIFFAWLGKQLDLSSSWLKVGYAMVLTELMSVFYFNVSRDMLQEHRLILMFSSAVLLVCVQLSFVSYKWAVLLIFKFEYQWYISKLISQEIPWPPVTTPLIALVGSILFCCYYKHFLEKCSYKLFMTHKLLKTKEEDKLVLLKLIADGLMVLDDRYTVTFTNDNILTYFDVPQEELLDSIAALRYSKGRKLCELTRSEWLLDDMLECFNLGINSEVTLGVTTAGETKLEWRAKKIRWTNQEVVIVSCRDVTPLLDLERSLKENDRKQVMLRSVSHDLNSPTQAIKTVSEQLLHSENLSPSDLAKIREIHYGSKLLLRLIQDILDYSKIVAGVFQIRKRACNIRKLIVSCIELAYSQVNPEKVTVSTRIDPYIPQSIYTDPVRLQQVLINLLSNSVKFTSKGSIEVCAWIGYSHKLKIEVRDTGIGMTPETRQHLFELFGTSSSHGLNEYGNGIGLNLANSLSIQLGGRPIRVQSEYGVGSTFTVTVNTSELNLDQSSSESEGSDGPEEGPGIPINPVVLPIEACSITHVLVVDDNSYTCQITSSNLADSQLPNSTASSGEEAIQTILRRIETSGQIKVILMDLNMQPKSGIETTADLINLYETQQLPFMPAVIGYTADESPEAVEECLQSGMVKVLSRSTPIGELVATISTYLER